MLVYIYIYIYAKIIPTNIKRGHAKTITSKKNSTNNNIFPSFLSLQGILTGCLGLYKGISRRFWRFIFFWLETKRPAANQQESFPTKKSLFEGEQFSISRDISPKKHRQLCVKLQLNHLSTPGVGCEKSYDSWWFQRPRVYDVWMVCAWWFGQKIGRNPQRFTDAFPWVFMVRAKRLTTRWGLSIMLKVSLRVSMEVSN